MRALVVVDVQNDFCEGGSLGVGGGAELVPKINDRMSHYDLVVATRDHHIDPGRHFSAHPDFVDSWPPHCVVGTDGVSLHPQLDQARLAAVFDKGEYVAAYSGFEGVVDGVPLAQWLRDRDVTDVDIVGIATDHCVRATALDAAREGFGTTVCLDLTAGVARDSTDAALAQLRDAGVALVGEPVVAPAGRD